MVEIASKFQLKFRADKSAICLPKNRKGPAVLPLEDPRLKELDDLDVQFIKGQINLDVEQELDDACLKLAL